MRTLTALGAIAVAALLAAPGSAQPASAESPLVGTWKINTSLSKRPERAGGGRVHFGGGFGGERGMEGHRGARPEGEGGRGGPFSPVESMRITMSGDDMHLVGDDGHVRVLTLNGTPVERHREYIDVTEKAQHTGTGITVTTTMPNGRTVTETFALADDGSGRLVHTITMPGRDGGAPRVTTWVYDREPSGKTQSGSGS